MDTATLSSEGQVTIPTHLREALHLQLGDTVHLAVDGERLILERAGPGLPRAKLIMGTFGRLVLVAPPGAPEMTPERVKAILEGEETPELATKPSVGLTSACTLGKTCS